MLIEEIPCAVGSPTAANRLARPGAQADFAAIGQEISDGVSPGFNAVSRHACVRDAGARRSGPGLGYARRAVARRRHGKRDRSSGSRSSVGRCRRSMGRMPWVA